MVNKIVNLVIGLLSILISCLFKFYTSIKLIWIPFVCFISLHILALVILYITSLFISFDKEYKTWNKYFHWTFMTVQKALIEAGRCKIVVNGLEKIPTDHRYLIVFNHTSYYDPMIINQVLKNEPIIHISKPENYKIPIAGKYMHRDCNLAFRRNDLKYNAMMTVKAANYIKQDKFSIGLAPEGTRNKGDTSKLLPFHEGVFKIPLRSERDMVVIHLKDVDKCKYNFPWHKTTVYFNVLKVYKYDEFKDKDTFQISSEVYQLMQNAIDNSK